MGRPTWCRDSSRTLTSRICRAAPARSRSSARARCSCSPRTTRTACTGWCCAGRWSAGRGARDLADRRRGGGSAPSVTISPIGAGGRNAGDLAPAGAPEGPGRERPAASATGLRRRGRARRAPGAARSCRGRARARGAARWLGSSSMAGSSSLKIRSRTSSSASIRTVMSAATAIIPAVAGRNSSPHRAARSGEPRGPPGTGSSAGLGLLIFVLVERLLRGLHRLEGRRRCARRPPSRPRSSRVSSWPPKVLLPGRARVAQVPRWRGGRARAGLHRELVLGDEVHGRRLRARVGAHDDRRLASASISSTAERPGSKPWARRGCRPTGSCRGRTRRPRREATIRLVPPRRATSSFWSRAGLRPPSGTKRRTRLPPSADREREALGHLAEHVVEGHAEGWLVPCPGRRPGAPHGRHARSGS